MAIQNFFTSRDNSANANTYVGQQDRLWYNISTNAIYVSDGSTPGGVPITLGEGVDIVANSISVNYVSSDDSTLIQFLSDVEFREGATVNNDLEVNGNIIFSGNISAAAVGKIGGITPGPGVNVSNTGLLTLSSANVPFSFGNFTANNNILTIVNNDEDMVLATQGSAEVQLVGNVGFYKTNGLPPDTANRFFEATEDGQIKIFVRDPDETIEGGVEIVGTTSGNIQAPGIEGTLLHITGSEDYPARIYIDGNDNYVSLVARRWNGTVDSPTQVLAGEAVLRLNTTAATDAGVGNVAMAQMRVVALENQTTTAQGSEFQFLATAIGTDAANRVEVANINVANGVSATKFTSAGNIDAGNINLSGNVEFGSPGSVNQVDLITFDTTANADPSTAGHLCWNSDDQTLNLGHPGGVVQQIGQELYMYARNNTGNTILDGTMVGFAGADLNGTARIEIAPYNANGSTPSLYAVGVTTQDIDDGEDGRVTVWGKVRDVNMSAFTIGDILYADPATIGGFSNVKPTAPNAVISVAAVLNNDSVNGEIFVRPTILPQENYGVFTRTTNLSPVNDTPTVVGFDNTEVSNGVSIVSNSRATVNQSGLYQIEWTLHWDSQGTGFGTDPVYTFLRKNGTDVPNTLRRNSVADFDPAGQTFTNVRALSLDADDYIEVVIVTTGGNVDLTYVAAITSPFNAPATASAELTVTQVQL